MRNKFHVLQKKKITTSVYIIMPTAIMRGSTRHHRSEKAFKCFRCKLDLDSSIYYDLFDKTRSKAIEALGDEDNNLRTH